MSMIRSRVPGSPIQTPLVQRLLPTPQGFSQATASFFASDCQGIHRMRFSSWPYHPIHRLTRLSYRIIYLPSLSHNKTVSLSTLAVYAVSLFCQRLHAHQRIVLTHNIEPSRITSNIYQRYSSALSFNRQTFIIFLLLKNNVAHFKYLKCFKYFT